MQFLPRDARRQRGLCCRPVSVRLSVTLVDYIQTAEDIVKLLSRPGSPIILVFDLMRRYPIPRRTRSAGTQNIRRVGKICDFRLKSPFIPETVQDRPMVAMER